MAWTPTHTSAAGSLMIAPQFLPVFRDYTRRPLASFLQSVLFSSTHYSFHATLPFHQFPPFQVLHQFLKNYSRYMRLLEWVTSASCHISLPPLSSSSPLRSTPWTYPPSTPNPPTPTACSASENVTDPQGENLAKRS